MRLMILGLMSLLVGCGYMDDDLLVDDEAYEETFGVGGLGLQGGSTSSSYGYGCGGSIGTFRRRHARTVVRAHSAVASEVNFLMLDDMHITGSTGQKIAEVKSEPAPAMVDGWLAVFGQMSEDRETVLRTASVTPQ